MTSRVVRIAVVAIVLLVSGPLSVMLTLLLMPFWRWFEAGSGIESVGHSGPAAWCYGASFLVCLAVLGLGGLRMARTSSHDETA